MTTKTPFSFPDMLPEIEVTRLDEPPFEVECRELRWWFIVPEVGRRRRTAAYDYPGLNRVNVYEWEAECVGKVHDRDSCEMRLREWDADGKLQESYAYGAIHEGMARWDGWWHNGMPQLIYTYKDEDFAWDWGESPARIADEGLFHWECDASVTKSTRTQSDPKVDPLGAGLWRVKIGGNKYRCLRAIDVDEGDLRRGVLTEAFITEEGRTVLFRRYNGPDYVMYGRDIQAETKDNPVLAINGTPFRLWHANLPEDVL